MTLRSGRADDEPRALSLLNRWNQRFRFLFAIVGQGLFSLSRFITTMVIGGRFNTDNVNAGGGSEADLGYYVAYFSVLLFGMGILDAFVTTPMTYLMHGRKDEQKPQFSTFLLLVCITAAAICLGLTLITGALVKIGYPSLSLFTLTAFGLMVATQFLREFMIRWLLAHLKMFQYAAYELGYFLFFAVAVWGIVAGQQIFLSTIFLIAAISNLLLIGVVWWRHQTEFTSIRATLQQTGLLKANHRDALDSTEPDSRLWSQFTQTMKEQIYFGRWLAVDSIFAVMTIYFFNWLLLLKIDATAAGIYGACMTIVLLANPLLNGVISAFAPTAAIEFQASGKPGLNKLLWQYGTAMVVLMSLFAVVLWFAGGPLTKLFYGDSYDHFFAEHYGGQNRIPFLLGLSMPLNAAAYLLACSLMACGHPKYICLSSVAGLVTVVGLGAMMTAPNLVSCALCFSISIGVTLALRVFFYFKCDGQLGMASGAGG